MYLVDDPIVLRNNRNKHKSRCRYPNTYYSHSIQHSSISNSKSICISYLNQLLGLCCLVEALNQLYLLQKSQIIQLDCFFSGVFSNRGFLGLINLFEKFPIVYVDFQNYCMKKLKMCFNRFKMSNFNPSVNKAFHQN